MLDWLSLPVALASAIFAGLAWRASARAARAAVAAVAQSAEQDRREQIHAMLNVRNDLSVTIDSGDSTAKSLLGVIKSVAALSGANGGSADHQLREEVERKQKDLTIMRPSLAEGDYARYRTASPEDVASQLATLSASLVKAKGIAAGISRDLEHWEQILLSRQQGGRPGGPTR